MGARGWVGWGLGLGALLACTGQSSSGPADSGRSRVAEADVELRGESAVRSAESLVLTYEVHNRTARAIWLLEGLYDMGPTGSVRLAPEKAYVDITGTTVVVSRMLHPTPTDRLVEAPEVPAASRVDAGQKVSRRVVLPLPVTEVLPYDSGPGETLAVEGVRELRLRVGYLVDAPELRLHEARDSDGAAYRTPGHGPAQQAQKVLERPVSVPGTGTK